MSYTGSQSMNNNASKNPSSSVNNNNNNNNIINNKHSDLGEEPKDNNGNDEDYDNDNDDDDYDIDGDEINEEEQEENDAGKDENKDESQTLQKEGEEGKGKLERLFIYLRSGFSWRPIPKIGSTVLCLEITGAVFIVIGIIIFIFSKKIKQIEIRYDDNPDCQIGEKCDINFTIPKNMEKNVFIYYRLKNFYQNHRRYIKSKSIKQLKGKIMQEKDIKDDCEPIILNKDIYEGVTSSDGLRTLDPDGVAHPCGLIAKSYFNDTYEIKRQGGNEEITINPNGIAWSVDKDKYKNSENYTTHQWLNVENERFMVWMRPAALPDFRKPWGRIEKDLDKGDYTVTITNNYPVKSFDGKKYFILSTVNWLGGKNYFLAILYLVIGGVCILAGILFWIGYKKYNNEKNQKIE